jgi:hypothetical protein
MMPKVTGTRIVVSFWIISSLELLVRVGNMVGKDADLVSILSSALTSLVYIS